MTQVSTAELNFVGQDVEQKMGYTSPVILAQAIIALAHTDKPYTPDYAPLADYIKRYPTEEFVYEGAQETMRTLFDKGHHIVIWTQGDPKLQTWKAATSGLVSTIRQTAGTLEDRHRLRLAAAEDKISLLRDVITNSAASEVVIVDDKSENIVNTQIEIERLKEEGLLPQDLPVHVVWINQGRTKNQVPQGFDLVSFKQQYRTIEDIRELLNLEIQESEGRKPLWLIDWDHTLANTGAWRESLYEQIAGEYTRPYVVDPFFDHTVGMSGHIVTHVYNNGMSGVPTFETRNGTEASRRVIKYSPNGERAKIDEEAAGYELLHNTPLAGVIAPLDTSHARKGFISTPYIEGQQLREGIQSGKINKQLAQQVFGELIDLKTQWWQKQKKSGINPAIRRTSMQRAEFADTQTRLTKVLQQLSNTHHIPLDALLTQPIFYQGRYYPSFTKALRYIESFFQEELPSDLLVLTHGDATGANIIVNPNTKKWKLFDYQWAGLGDPAESFVRMAKHESTSLLRQPFTANLTLRNGSLNLSMHADIPATAQNLQDWILSQAPTIAEKIEDPNFPTRIHLYMAGSYLREAALSMKRGNPNYALFAIIKAGEYLNIYD